MSRKLCFVFALLFTVTVCRGGTIYWDLVTWGLNHYGLPDMYLLDITTPDPSGVTFRTDVDVDSPEQAILQRFRGGGTFACGSSTILQVTHGTLVNHGLVSDDITGWFYQIPNENTSATPDLMIPLTDSELSNTVLLAFVLHCFDWTNLPEMEWYYWYGWVELGYRDATGHGDMEVYIVASAMSRDPLLAGVIPEPSTALLALSGAVLLLRRSRPKVAQVF